MLKHLESAPPQLVRDALHEGAVLKNAARHRNGADAPRNRQVRAEGRHRVGEPAVKARRDHARADTGAEIGEKGGLEGDVAAAVAEEARLSQQRARELERLVAVLDGCLRVVRSLDVDPEEAGEF